MTRRPNNWRSLFALTKYENARRPYIVYESKSISGRFRRPIMAAIYLGEYAYWQFMGRRKARQRGERWVS